MGAFLRLIHANRAVDEFGVVHLFDRRGALFLIGHFDETKTAGAASFLVFNHPSVDHFAIRLESSAQIIVCGLEREIPNIYFHNLINYW